MLRQFSTKRIIGSFIFDIFCTLIALLLATYLRFGIEGSFWATAAELTNLSSDGNWPTHIIKPQVILLVSIIWPFFLIVFAVYDGRRNPSRKTEIVNVFLAICTATLVLAGALFLTYRETSRLLFGLFFIIDVLFLIGGRGIFYLYQTIRNGNGKEVSKQVLILGAGEVGKNVALELTKYAERNIQVLGFLDDDSNKVGRKIAGYPVLGNLNQIIDLSEKLQIQDAVIALPLRAHKRIIEIAKNLQNTSVHVHIIPDLFSLLFPNASLDGFGGIPVIDLGKPGISKNQRTLKRVFDVLSTTLVMLFATPIMLMVAILIKIDSPGPVFFKQKRIGENKIPFNIYKFRSMRFDTDDDLHKTYVRRLISENISPQQQNGTEVKSLKIEKDPRVTRVGHIIRKLSIDELPQIFNVLRGEMSLVGPRPPLPYEFEIYQDWHMYRLIAPPGITGLWQVKARNQVSFDEMVRMDIEYINNYSFWLDIKLLLKTPWALINTKGAG